MLALGVLPTAPFPCFADRALEAEKPWLHYKLLEYLGSQPGLPLGSDAGRDLLLNVAAPWIYDRGTGLLLEVSHAHPLVAALLYCLHKKTGWASEQGDAYVIEHMGFWLSSVSKNSRTIHVAPGLKLTAQERMAFRPFKFREI